MGLSIIIPSKTASNLVPCVQAIRDAGETCRIIVVDDGVDWNVPNFKYWIEYPQVDEGSPHCASGIVFTDAELEAAAAPFRYRGLVAEPRPAGTSIYRVAGAKPFVFARNINIGIQAAGDDDVILLNDDAKLVTPQGFTSMWQVAVRNPEFGILSSTCNNVGNPLQNRVPGALASGLEIRRELRTLAFVCVCIPRRVINEVGLLDERFVGYGMDDDDYCLRVRKVGYKLGIFDGCYVDHGSLVSSYRGGPTKGGDFQPNLKLFIEKWGVDNWGRRREQSEFKHLFPKSVA